jgi:hypothetical protein
VMLHNFLLPPLVTVLYDVENNSTNPAKFLYYLEAGIHLRFPGCFLRKYVVCCAGTIPQVIRQREELALNATLVDTGVQESQRADKIIEKICKQTLMENCVNGEVFRPFITILVSGDGDFVPMLKSVDEAGGKIVVVAKPSVISQVKLFFLFFYYNIEPNLTTCFYDFCRSMWS